MRRKSNENSGITNGAINLSATEQVVLSKIISNPNVTREKLRTETYLGKGIVDRAIKSLKEKGFMERVGSNKTGYWIIK